MVKLISTREINLKISELAGWLFIFFIICACMFTLGVLIGRQTLPVIPEPDKLEKELMQLKKQDLKKQQEEFEQNQKSLKKSEFEFYEELKKNKPSYKLYKKTKKRHTSENTNFSSESSAAYGKYTIQAASFRKMSDAVRLAEKLKKLGYSVYIDKSSSSEKTWHRIKVDHFETREQAELMLNRLKQDRIQGFILKDK